MKTIDIIMPTLNRDIIIEHSIKSILSPKLIPTGG